ncbi:MAG: tetratricopeptide repeat protein [Magnetococcales bacterium]|nr:tetratricopeptide repeat protein [Magnetococcales bacterium]
MSMLLKALESVEQDRKKREKGKISSPSVQDSDVAAKSDSGGFATPPDEMSLEFEPGGGLEIPQKDDKAFEDEGIETLEFEFVEPPPKPVVEESQTTPIVDDDEHPGLDFEFDGAVATDEVAEVESPIEEGGSKFAGLAFDLDKPEATKQVDEPEEIAFAEDGSSAPGLSFDMNGPLEAMQPIESEPAVEQSSSDATGLSFDMDDLAPNQLSSELDPLISDGEVADSSGLLFEMEEPAQTKEVSEHDPSIAQDDYSSAGLSFTMESEATPVNSSEPPPSNEGGGMLSSLAFAAQEDEQPAMAEKAATPVKGGGLLSSLGFAGDDDVEPGGDVQPAAVAQGGGLFSSLGFAADDGVETVEVREQAPPVQAGSTPNAATFKQEQIVENIQPPPPEPAAKGGGMISSSSFEMEEVIAADSGKATPKEPVAEPPPPPSPPAPVVEDIEEEDDEDDTTDPVFAEGQDGDRAKAEQQEVDDTPPEDEAEDGWDASGELDKTAVFNPAFLDSKPEDNKPKKMFGEAVEDGSEEQNTNYGVQQESKKQESLQQKAKSIFDATGKSSLPIKKYAIAASGVLVIGGGAFFAYQMFFSTPTSQFPKQPPRVMRPVNINPANQNPAALLKGTPQTSQVATAPQNNQVPHEDLQPEKPMQIPVAVADDSRKVASVAREEPIYMPVEEKPEPPPKPEEVSHDILMDAQSAYYSGEVEGSGKLFKKVLLRDKHNRDAMMGLAAVAVRKGEHDKASGFYQSMLRENPKDSLALAGLAGLRAEVDPVAKESQIKTLLRSEPNAHHLHFALGSLYAVQKRWGVAQKAFFEAYSLSATNPDYAYNLAVSMDHLGHVDVATKYYQTALALLTVRPGNFNKTLAEDRLAAFKQMDKIDSTHQVESDHLIEPDHKVESDHLVEPDRLDEAARSLQNEQ